MSSRAQNVLNAALELPEDERAEVVAAILGSLGPETTDEEPDEDEFVAELERRLDECRRDPSASVSWAELRDGL